ncbi:type IV secretion system DNA-binding domain-containing protein [Patescibacteria group bacterium]|nr:type IV secretion system DNA-binding domain-containing protein [Patescibacteria group bacterium]MBU1931328.1 type IV secretion system DNA-binding domain-containing protein [Patescibacteria group bacterium]
MDRVLLEIRLPKDNSNKESVAEEMLAGWHSILRPKDKIWQKVTKRPLSLEIVAQAGNIRFFIFLPNNLTTAIESQINASYPEAEVIKTTDYAGKEFEGEFLGCELRLNHNHLFPIKTYEDFKTDSLNSLLTAMAKFSSAGKKSVWFQIVIQPVGSHWYQRGLRQTYYTLFNKTSLSDKSDEWLKLPHYQAVIRMVYLSANQSELTTLTSRFNQFKTDYNEFKPSKFYSKPAFLTTYQQRAIFGKTCLLNTRQLATFWHLPYSETKASGVVSVTSKKAEPPWNLPKEDSVQDKEISLFGQTTFRNENTRFGIKRIDRPRHLYIIGKTGMGKSKLLELLILADIYQNHGFAILDPHGDLAEAALRYIPQSRIKDVVYFNPADLEHPLAFNPMESVEDPEAKQHIAAGFVGIFKKIFGVNWNPRLEHMIRYITLALLDTPQATVLGIIKILSDKTYRQNVISQIKDPVVKNFWVNEFAAWNEKFDNEAIVPILNKVGQFVASQVIRNTVGQAKSSFDLLEIMNQGKILIMNLSTGRLGEDNSALLGAMVVTRFQQAAMERARIAEAERRPFYLYVDEFQNFATDAFVNILSEARKYKLCLTVAHQYIAQLPEEVKATAFGNVGSLICFRLGADDAEYLQREFAPAISAQDMINLDFREQYVKMSIDGKVSPAFSAYTLSVPTPPTDFSAQIVAASRSSYCRSRQEVEAEIAKWQVLEEIEDDKPEFSEPIV